MDKRTKVLATLGPASSKEAVLQALFEAGVNVVRLNCSHGTTKEREQLVKKVRTLAQSLGKHIGILMDLQGPKVRIGTFNGGSAHLKDGQRFTLKANTEGKAGTAGWVGLDTPRVLDDLETDQILLLDDGQIQLRVDVVEEKQALCTVIQGGELSDHKGINILGGGLSFPALTDKDLKDIDDAVAFDVDYLAVSFVKDAHDIEQVRARLPKNTAIKIIAKIERKEAIVHLDEIIDAADGIMVARGDLAIEVGDAEVPVLQKHMIKQARNFEKPVIVATHMMQSMIYHPTPTRAEVSDVANAILDGTDAVMLSAETATGAHPIAVIRTVHDICVRVEKYAHRIYDIKQSRLYESCHATNEAIASATMYTAQTYPLSAIVTLTENGTTALLLSRFSSHIPIIALSRTASTLQQMTLLRNVTPVYFDATAQPSGEVNSAAIATLLKAGLLSEGDTIGLTKGSPIGVAGHTNSLQILSVEAH